MPSHAPKESADPQSFLRTGPESTLSPEARPPQAKEGHTHPDRTSIFPAPEISSEVRTRLETWENFAALAVCIDPMSAQADRQAVQTSLEACLARTLQEKNGFWYPWGTDLYGCAVPACDTAEANELAVRLQTQLAQECMETISIGLSQFPLLDFDRAATMQNCCKALDHAAFFGPGSRVGLDSVSLNICGDQYYQHGQMEEAVREYRTALRLNSKDVNVLNSLGVCLARLEDRGGAREFFQKALHVAPNEAMAIFNLGVLDELEGDSQSALERFRQALHIDPNTFEIPFHISKLLWEQNTPAEAVPMLKTALKINPTYAPAYALLGQCLEAMGQPREAISALKKAVKLNPNDAAALSALGTLYDQKGENPEICLTFCRQSVALCPDIGLYRWRLARLYQKYNQMEAALAEFEAAAAQGYDAAAQLAEIRDQMENSAAKKQCCAG